jgi:hypothetical protein
MKNLNKVFSFLFAIMAIFFVSNFVNVNSVLAEATQITSFTLNGLSQNIKFNPQNKDEVSINITMSNVVKISRIYICTLDQLCNSTRVNYTRYFQPSATTSSISQSWDGKISSASDAALASEGEYRVMVSFYENGASTFSNLFGQYHISSDFSGSSTPPVDPTPPIIPPTPTSTPTTTIPIASSTAPNTNPTIIYSVHYISEDLSDYTEPTTFEISAGRDRLGYINSPVSFVAKNKVSKDLQNTKCNYVWNFGDGISEPGEKVEHIYKYAGNYNVILNGVCGNWRAVSRTVVKIVEAKLLINKKDDGAIEISNQGQYEINLFNWKISAGNLNYTFPMDTIISAGKAVTFPAEYLKIPTASSDVILADVSGKERGKASLKTLASGVIDSERVITVADFERFAVEYKRLTPPKNYLAVNPTTTAPSPFLVKEGEREVNISLSASVADVVVSADSSDFGFWSKLFHPVRTIKNTFYK